MDQQRGLRVTARFVDLPPELKEGRGSGRGSERRPREVLKVGHCSRLSRLAVLEIETADDVIIRVRVLRDQTYLIYIVSSHSVARPILTGLTLKMKEDQFSFKNPTPLVFFIHTSIY